ncbi:putative cysteine-rich receptor-like protein kinase 39 [Triticum urartu]|uniref:putative cysteine-rich receptor-like protein kinase 39 n=1 Tax=Triticum urartu TaxID=4572 RepID=UPI002044C592|nr:putative cysteine-rich receptor-like protein kinase 39 [Triticum urartu]
MPGHDDVQFDKEFYNLVNLQHQNIVELVGYCHETRQEYLPYNKPKVLANVTKRALCFEYMENGSLSDCLSDEFKGHGWRNRYAIIKGISNGLKYLHEELKTPIFHLDLKPANILLDKKMIPKIADFGLSRFFMEDKSYSTDSPIGTRLGVVVIKIIAGSKGHCRSAEMTSEQFTEIKRPTIGDIVNMLTDTETPENYHGALIDQMSTFMVKDTGLKDVHPLSAVCATTGETKTSEVILRDGDRILRSMDVHPTEPW